MTIIENKLYQNYSLFFIYRNMTAITGSMLGNLREHWKLTMPNDDVTVDAEWNANVEVDHYVMQNGLLVPKRTTFNSKLWQILDWFQYAKPQFEVDVNENTDPETLLRPETIREDKVREWFHVVWIVGNSARMANHIDAVRDAIIVLVDESGWEWESKWNTRYFPEQNIPAETWKEAMSKLVLK